MDLVSGLEILGAAVGGLVLTLGGLALEILAFQRLLGGDITLGMWMVVMGAIVLFLGLKILDSKPLDPQRFRDRAS